MLEQLRDNLESFEAINQDDMTRDLVLRMSALSQAGKLAPFLFELTHDAELDELTKGTLVEIATTRASCSRSRTTSSAPRSSTEPRLTDQGRRRLSS
jgi:hypothetical protein